MYMETIIKVMSFFFLCVIVLIGAHLRRKTSLKEIANASRSAYTREEVKRARYLCVFISCTLFIFAVDEWIDPSVPPFAGRGAGLASGLYYGFGPHALAFLLALCGTLIFMIAVFKKPYKKR